jgi:hypothetical protein
MALIDEEDVWLLTPRSSIVENVANLYSTRGEVIHFCTVGIAHRREPPRPKTVGDAHPTMAHSSPRKV